MFSLVNQARQGAGLAPLSRSGGIDGVARGWANHMATNGVFDHNPSYAGQMPGGWSAVAENVGYVGAGAAAGGVASTLHSALMRSPGHRDNIMNPAYTQIGIGVYHHPQHGYYLTQNFGAY